MRAAHHLSANNPNCPSNSLVGRLERVMYFLRWGNGWVVNCDASRLGIGANLIDPGYVLDRYVETEDREPPPGATAGSRINRLFR